MEVHQINQPPKTTERLHGFDAIRVVGMLLVVLLHAAAPYLVNRMPGLLWPTREQPSHLVIDGLFWGIEGFVMTLFFVLSGYFACQLYQRRGLAGYLWQRTRRLLLPLLLATVIILPLTAYVWVFGWYVEGHVAAVKLRSFKFPDHVAADFFGFAHLWYLQYLSIYCLVMGGILALRRSAVSTLQSVTIPVAGFACCVLLLAVDPEIIVGFQQSLFPVGSRFAYFGIVFGMGVWLFNKKEGVANVQQLAWPALLVSVAVFGGTLPLVLTHLEGGVSIAGAIGMSLGVNTFAWATTIALIGLFTKYVSKRNEIIGYLADASFWVYLVHMPIVGAVHIILSPTGLSAELKLCVSFVVAVGLSLASFELLVRRWRVAGWLNGEAFAKRQPATVASPLVKPFDSPGIREAA